MLSGGALAAAGSSWLLDWPVWADGAVFLVVSVLLLALVRPASSAGILAGKGMLDPVKALEGKSALVLDRVSRHDGQVKLDGEVWTARPLNDDDVYEPGDHVTVMHIDGATAVVWRRRDNRATNGRNPDGRCGRGTRTPGGAGDLRHHRGGQVRGPDPAGRGRRDRTAGPLQQDGVRAAHLLLPFVDRIRARVDLRERVVSFPRSR